MEAIKQISNQKYEITHEQLKAMYDAIIVSDALSKKHLDNLKKLSKLHKLSIDLSGFALNLMERIKDRYPYIWNECTNDCDIDYVTDIVAQLDKG